MIPIQNVPAFRVIGLPLRTSNAEASHTIGPHWQRFSQEGVLSRIPGKLSDEVFAVYTHFEHEGVDNNGLYTLVIGAAVPAETDVPEGLIAVTLPASARMVFEVERGRVDLVGAAWERIWNVNERQKTFVADYERFQADGQIDIFVGVAA
ncbi:MAG: hypothetical protein RLZZ618_1538 [Pseudomonadota bacterium]|jgi:predicted transcriptional regulator YdeE